MWKPSAIAIAIVMHLSGVDVSAAAKKNATVTVMPGESRAISHALSASRDTALMAYEFLPRVVLTNGADFAYLGFNFKGMSLRLGAFGMIQLQNVEVDGTTFIYIPGGHFTWRGLLGGSVALSLDELAVKWLGARGKLEATVSVRHESDHWTGGREINEEQFRGIPQIGNFIMPDIAMRLPAGSFDLELRAQFKFFLPTEYHTYTVGPGADLIVRWHLLDWLHPFFSSFGEYLVGRNGEMADNYLLRALLGIIFPGRVADIQLFAAFAYGHEKGLLVPQKGGHIGWGIRFGLFKWGGG